MRKFEIKKVNSRDKIDALSNISALTFTGLDPSEESLKQVIGWLDNHSVNGRFVKNVLEIEKSNGINSH